MLEWEDGDRYSFEDSERFEDESECSWLSEPESLCNNWRGWKKQSNASSSQAAATVVLSRVLHPEGQIKSLAELCARTVAAHIPFEVVEQMMPVVPEQIQLWIAYWSFPENEEDIRLYSCLANGNADEFIKGENLYKHNGVEDMLQIGFHLSATVINTGTKGKYKVAVTFDRGRITTCNCTCSSNASWCSHIVSVCLHRIHQPTAVKLRAPVSESLSRLQRDQLQKFAQYLISELPQQILPTAQRLIDEILSSQSSDINTVSGAPDPTAGASANEQTAWWLDENNLHENIHKILVKFCVPSPMVFSDVNYLSSTAPPVAAEWQSLLRPLRGREPEGMWNLLSIVREMFRRHDHNAIPLLEVITEAATATEKILVWWVNTRVALHCGSSVHGGKSSMNSNGHGSQYACSSLCDEIVSLWRLAALNPALSPKEGEMLRRLLKQWHLKVLDRVAKSKEVNNATPSNNNRENKRGNDMDIFPGFKPAFEACFLDWNDYPLPGITYCRSASRYYCPVMCCKHDASHTDQTAPISGGISMPLSRACIKRSSHNARSSSSKGNNRQWLPPVALDKSQRSSSVSSEGFCDNEVGRDSDSSHDLESAHVMMQKLHRRTRHKTDGFDDSPTSNLASDDQDQGCSLEMETDSSKKSRRDGNNYFQYAFYPRNPLQSVNYPYGDTNNRGAGNDAMISNGNIAANRAMAACNSKGNSGASASSSTSNNEMEKSDVFSCIRKLEDPIEILFARAEGLHAHGHIEEASRLAVQLAQELLTHPPNLMIDIAPVSKSKKKKVNSGSQYITSLASDILTKCGFLCTVLSEEPGNTHLAFKIALFGLEMPRPPAATKPLEVKLANQESDLVGLLKKITLGPRELNIIRDRAEQMRSGTYKTKGESLLPLMLATFIFDALVVSASARMATGAQSYRHLADEKLGFQAAVSALALKANVSEADHPLLCEGTRRQRGDLSLTLLTTYKDDQEHLAIIMDKFLDKEVHQMYKAPSLPTYYTPVNAQEASEANSGVEQSANQQSASVPPSSAAALQPNVLYMPNMISSNMQNSQSPMWMQPKAQNTDASNRVENLTDVMSCIALSPPLQSGVGGARPKMSAAVRYPSVGSESPGAQDLPSRVGPNANFQELETEVASWVDQCKEWDDKNKKKMVQGGRPNEDGAEPLGDTVVPSNPWLKRGPASDSGSSGNSSDSINSFSSLERNNEPNKPIESPPLGYPLLRPPQHSTPDPLPTQSRSIQPQFVKGIRYKGKRAYPTVPNQPSEASAYFMFELAKTVLVKAGGTSSTALFKQPPSGTSNHRGPNRALQMCAFQIGLYALGLSNCVTPNWLSRTYSSHVSWISNQALEIGSSALSFLIDTWEGHLTPQEAASIADKASRGRDSNTIKQAARLALSCLPHAHALNPNEIQRAIIQCKEQSNSMLEGACLSIESAAKGGGVYPEVLFSVAKCWYEVYENRSRIQARHIARTRPVMGINNRMDRPDQPVDLASAAQEPNISRNGDMIMASGISGGSNTTNSHMGIQVASPVGTLEACLHPSASNTSVGVTVASIPPGTHSIVPTYHVGTGGPPHNVGYPIQGVPYPLSYNYVQSLPQTVSCINQLPVQMYIQSPVVPFNSPQSAVGNVQQALLPPPSLQSIQYYPPVSIQNAGSQVTSSSILSTSLANLNAVQSPMQQGMMQANHPSQGYYSLPYGGTINAANVSFQPSQSSSHSLMQFVRAQHQQQQPQPIMVQHHQNQVVNTPTTQAQQPCLPPPSGLMHYLVSAYRVGMLALETLARRVQDDRPQAKYARNPPYGEDVKWLLGIAKKLGTQYLHQFCLCSVNSVVSPFILYDLAMEVASYLPRNSPPLYHQHLRSPILQPLIQKCQQMFIQCSHLKMYYMTPGDYEEFVSIMHSARLAFQMTPGGMVHFNELLQTLRRSKCCKKELWQRLSTALQQPQTV